MKQQILEILSSIEDHHNIRVLWAVESGSRSWGFESPDSDYDVRFIYVNKPDWYLTIDEGRDVIERPVDGLLDISGWDLRKTLRLFCKSNPVLMEWLVSPFVYKAYGDFRDELLSIASESFSLKASSYHYLRMAENNYNQYVLPRNPVKTKKYFYVLRPLLNILWLKQKGSIPPMQFSTALNGLDIPTEVFATIQDLLAQKVAASEMGKGPKIPVLEDFIQKHLIWAKQYCETAPVGQFAMDKINRLFRQTLIESWRS